MLTVKFLITSNNWYDFEEKKSLNFLCPELQPLHVYN